MFSDALHRWSQAADHFLQVVEGVPYVLRAKSGACGDWSVQQVVAHLAGWQREALRRYEIFQTGDYESIKYDIDDFNAKSVAALKLLSWHEVLDTFRFTREDLQTVAESLAPQAVENNPLYEQWLVGIGEDLEEHTAQLEQWLQAQKG